MTEYIIEIPDECFASYEAERDMYYPDERDSAMRITPIVRCRDCKYRYGCLHLVDDGDDDMRRCHATPDGFCVWGKPRGEGDTE